MTRGEWTTRFLRYGDFFVTKRTKRAVLSWVTAEGTKAKFNPLATTQPMSGATDFNSVGVKNYPDLKTGLEATVKTLGFSGHGYGAIVRRLKRDDTAAHILEAVEQSDWGTGGLAVEVLEDVKDDYESFADRPIGT
jgi:hypothetical protein